MQNLKERERAVLDYIRRVTLEKGYAPSVRDICMALNYKSTSTVQMYLDRLTSYGYIRREEGKSRSIALAEMPKVISIPILADGAKLEGTPKASDLDGRLDFCYTGELTEGAVLYAARVAESDEYAVIAGGVPARAEKPVAVMSAGGVLIRSAADLPETAILGRVIATVKLF